jgi:hypothetical protein
MNPRSLCAIVLALALPALGQTEPQIEPLVPPDSAPAKTKKKSKKAPTKPPSSGATRADGQLSLPPLAPLTEPRPLKSVGVLVHGTLPADAAARVREGLRAAASLAPGVKETLALEAPQPCADEACWVTAGIARNVDHVAVASWVAGTLRVRLVDVGARRVAQDAQRAGVSSDPVEAAAWTEALACKVMVPAGCSGQLMVEADFGISLELDGEPLRPGEKRLVPVGVHALRIKEGTSELLRELPVLLEGTPAVSIASSRRPAPPPTAAPVAAVAASPSAPPAKRSWTRTAGYAAAGAAVLAAGAGVYFGAKSKSDLDKADSGYRANGGAYQPADLQALQSGNSAAHTANALYIVSGVLLVAGAALTFAF